MPKIVDHDARRQAIVEALWRVVDRDGFAAVSVRSVAAEAGFSRATIGHYFTSQAAVIAFAVEQNLNSVAQQLITLDLDNCTLDIAVDALLIVVPTTPERRRQAQVWLALAADPQPKDPAVARSLIHLNVTVRVGMMVVIRAMRRQGLVSPTRNTISEAARLHALVDGLSVQTLSDPLTMPPTEVANILRYHLQQLASAQPEQFA